MSQPQALTTAELQAYSDQLANGTVADAEQVYADLYSKGYSYAGWAGGVASQSTIAGVSAVNFLTGTAMMGWGGPQCRNLSEASLDSIRIDMARRYVETLRIRSTREGGQISKDVTYEETRQFHDQVFSAHNLSLDNWTLNTPMELVRQTQGDEAVEALWGKVRDTGGDGWDALAVNFELYHIVSSLRFDPTYQEQAQTWIDEVPGFANFEEWGRLIDTVKEWLNNTQVGRMWNAIHQVIESDPLFLVNPLLNTAFTSARAVVLQRDPLVLDLDGDGLELSAAGGNVLFDHNADGIKTGTGWARPDDGLLVRDLNANGSIDSGRELFGVDTVKSNGQMATQGFDALADLDSNADGQITSADAAWAQLQVWRDTNQDGTSAKAASSAGSMRWASRALGSTAAPVARRRGRRSTTTGWR